jgi:hypothetical protein
MEDASRRRRATDVRDEVEIRRPGDRRLARSKREFAERPQERNERGVIDMLIADDADAIPGHERAEFGNRLRRGCGDVDTRDLHAERVQRTGPHG